MIIHTAKDKKTHCIDGLGVWPKLITPDYFQNRHGGKKEVRQQQGVQDAPVPSLCRGSLDTLRLDASLFVEAQLEPDCFARGEPCPVAGYGRDVKKQVARPGVRRNEAEALFLIEPDDGARALHGRTT